MLAGPATAERSMASVTSSTSPLFLELDGKMAGPLRTAQPASLRVDKASPSTGRETVVRRSARVALGEMAAAFDLVEPGPLIDWLQATLAGDLAPHDGALLVGDANFNVRRRIGFRGARLSSLTWPLLDAAGGKQAVSLALRWLVDGVDDAPSSGKVQGGTGRRKALWASNFRVTGLPFGDDAVSAVDLPTLQVDWSQDPFSGGRQRLQMAQRRLGELAVTITSRRAESARAWVHRLVADGSIDERDGLTLQVDLLDAALKKAWAGVQLTGCLLCGMDEAPLGGAAADRTATLTLRFDVGGMRLSLA
jgi:hypothetical protein